MREKVFFSEQYKTKKKEKNSLQLLKIRFSIKDHLFPPFQLEIVQEKSCLEAKIVRKIITSNNNYGKRSLDRISLDRNCHFSLDRKF